MSQGRSNAQAAVVKAARRPVDPFCARRQERTHQRRRKDLYRVVEF